MQDTESPPRLTHHWLLFCLRHELAALVCLGVSLTVVCGLLVALQADWTSALIGIAIGLIAASVLAAIEFRKLLLHASDSLAHDASEDAGDERLPLPHERALRMLEILAGIDHEVSSAHTVSQRYELLINNLAAAVIIREPSGKIMYASPYTEVLTGHSLPSLYAEADDFFLRIAHSDDRERYLRAMRVSTAGEPFQFRFRFYHMTGIEMWAETRAVPMLDEDGEVTATLSITLDVTSSVRYQRQVEEKNRDLQDFTSMVSHDLKSPIFTIKGMLAMLEEDYREKLDAGFGLTLDHLSRASLRLEQLVGSVLEYTRITTQEVDLMAVPLHEVLADVQRDFEPQLKATDASFSLPDHTPLVLADRLRLYQIFSNLVSNAIKYRDHARKPLISISCAQAGPYYLTVSVRDNGLGVPADKLSEIFRPFHRLHTTEIEGTGIGLACVKRLSETIGGEVRVESNQGIGSTFHVTLRVAPE